MEYKRRELDIKALREKILHKCRKKTEPLILPNVTEDEKHKKENLYEQNICAMKIDKIIELPFENILAEKHRKYTTKEEKKKNEIISILRWKLSLLNEFAEIKFYNNNSYCGRVNRKMMEDEEIYKWHNGIKYKINIHICQLIYLLGQFECNKVQGKDLLK
ncbi:hypothetical protein P5V15_010098 [Pogonomyrmex californicus]